MFLPVLQVACPLYKSLYITGIPVIFDEKEGIWSRWGGIKSDARGVTQLCDDLFLLCERGNLAMRRPFFAVREGHLAVREPFFASL